MPDTGDGAVAALSTVLGSVAATGTLQPSVIVGCAIGVVLVAFLRRIDVLGPPPPPAAPAALVVR